MPNDADSLIEPDVDEAAEHPSTDDAEGDVAEAEAADADDTDASANGQVDTDDATQAVPLVDDPDEDGYDGVDYSDGDFEDDEYEYEYVDGEMLFEGDPDEYELDFGPGGYAAPARPQPGDVLVLDDAGMHQPPPRPRRMSRMERRRRVRLQARRVRRIIRHVEPWSVLKVSIFFYACLWVIFLVAGFMIWGVAESSGTVDKLESLITDLFALDTFDFDAGQIFRGYALGGLALSIAGTTFNVLMCLLFNLISDLTGGVRITMIEEESARPIPPRRRRRRRPPPRR